MSRTLKVSAIALLALLTLVPVASAQRRVVIIRHYGFYGPGWYGWYGPYWGSPYAYAYPVANTGEVKLVTRMKDASVYIDGGYAGTAGKLKKFPLRAGNHDIELRNSDGHTLFQERVQVIRGKTVEVDAGQPG